VTHRTLWLLPLWPANRSVGPTRPGYRVTDWTIWLGAARPPDELADLALAAA
jgi:hypothetical protein